MIGCTGYIKEYCEERGRPFGSYCCVHLALAGWPQIDEEESISFVASLLFILFIIASFVVCCFLLLLLLLSSFVCCCCFLLSFVVVCCFLLLLAASLATSRDSLSPFSITLPSFLPSFLPPGVQAGSTPADATIPP